MSTTPKGPNTGRTPDDNDEPSGPLPPYEGRKENADVEPAGSGGEAAGVHKGGVNVGGGQRPKESAPMKAPEPGDTPGGEHAAPSDEQPASESGGDRPAEADTGPAHQPGTPRGEKGGA
jgi:hypothetical protein